MSNDQDIIVDARKLYPKEIDRSGLVNRLMETVLKQDAQLKIAVEALEETVDACEAFDHEHCNCLTAVDALEKLHLLPPQ